jgi:hypothetical protein
VTRTNTWDRIFINNGARPKDFRVAWFYESSCTTSTVSALSALARLTKKLTNNLQFFSFIGL